MQKHRYNMLLSINDSSKGKSFTDNCSSLMNGLDSFNLSTDKALLWSVLDQFNLNFK